MGIAYYIIIGAFLALIFWMGSYFYRWIGSPDDFYVAGRKLTPFILAATLIANDIYTRLIKREQLKKGILRIIRICSNSYR